ncbi:MAG: hypothetical protein QXF86_01690 [Candidatus Bilamarchaeaceae archaeon]
MALCGNIEINPKMVSINKKTVKNKKDVKKHEPLLEKVNDKTKKYGGTCGNIE